MDPDMFLPLTAKLSVVVGTFIAFLVLSDVLLVRWLKLGKVAWKRVDYIWLGFTALGLLGAVSQARMASASAQLGMHEVRAAAALDSVKSLVELYASTPGAICRTFVRSESSPPPDEFQRTQAEYNSSWAWAKQVHEVLSKRPSSPAEPIEQASLPPRPDTSNGAIRDMYRGLDFQLALFDRASATLRSARELSKHTDAEASLLFLGPFLLAFALALRITKVTGEIKLEA